MNILLVSPQTPVTFWGFQHVLPFISRKAAFPPLGLLTVAAMLPSEWTQRLVDLNVRSLKETDIEWADYILLSGVIIHTRSVREVAQRCAAHSKPIIAGGPLFTSGHREFPEIPHFVLGEAEDIMPTLVQDMMAGCVQPVYQRANRPDIRQTPVPKWDLIDLRHYATMSVQFSRGCPFDCEFCDITAMYGRVPRTKMSQQVLAELDALIAAGWNGEVFLVDDNFIGNRARVRELLQAMIEWRQQNRARVTFFTEASLNLVDHPDLLDLMVRAGFRSIFVGIESPQPESLVECGKVQNQRRDLVEAVGTLHRAGLEVMGGFILGFDHDCETIFDQQRDFIERTGIVTAMVGLLNALPGTRLFTRLTSEGRISDRSSGNNLDATLNFIPKLDREVLVTGYRHLMQSIYSPRNYYRRILRFLREHQPCDSSQEIRVRDVKAFVRSLWTMGIVSRGRIRYWFFLTTTLVRHPRQFAHAMRLAIIGHHFRRVAASL